MFKLNIITNTNTNTSKKIHSKRNIQRPLLNSANVNIVSNNGNKYVFNNGTQYVSEYTISSSGEYIFRNVPAAHLT